MQMRYDAAAAAVLIILAVLMTWPLAAALDRAVIYPDDPYINTWILDWDWYATLHQPLALFEANLFYPAHDSLAFSENLFGIALPLMPIRALGASPLVAHNLAIILGFALSGFGAYVAARVAQSSRFAALAGGIFYAFVPFRFTHLHHVQYVWSCWPPLMLAALFWYSRRPSWRRAMLFCGAFAMNGLTNVYWLLFASLAAVLVIPILVAPRDWLRLAVAVAIAMCILAPFLYPYAAASRMYEMQRSWAEIRESSATLRDWLNPGELTRLYAAWNDRTRNPECWLFPGILGIGLAAGGVFAARRSTRVAAAASVWVILGLLGSLGVHTFFYRFLFAFVPGFHAARVPARWANMTYAGMAILIAFAVTALERRRAWSGVAIAMLFVIELRAAPIRWYVTTPDVPETYRWMRSAAGPVAEWPMDSGECEYEYTRWAAVHHRRTVNGISGFAPPEFSRLSDLSKQLPFDGYVAELGRIGVRHLVIHGEAATPAHRASLRQLLAARGLFFETRCDHGIEGDWIFSLRAGAGAAASPELERFLRGEYTFNNGTFGLFDTPLADSHVKGAAIFSGWALSPYGVKKVDLLFDSGRVRLHTKLRPEPSLNRGFPWYDATTRPRFVAMFAQRPANVRRETNVQVEITDGAGEVRLLEGRRLDWD